MWGTFHDFWGTLQQIHCRFTKIRGISKNPGNPNSHPVRMQWNIAHMTIGKKRFAAVIAMSLEG
jgi:hypothetical protein